MNFCVFVMCGVNGVAFAFREYVCFAFFTLACVCVLVSCAGVCVVVGVCVWFISTIFLWRVCVFVVCMQDSH